MTDNNNDSGAETDPLVPRDPVGAESKASRGAD